MQMNIQMKRLKGKVCGKGYGAPKLHLSLPVFPKPPPSPSLLQPGSSLTSPFEFLCFLIGRVSLLA